MPSGSPILRSRCFVLPKRGNSQQEYEDAIASNDSTGRYAVADGASESICAGEWAKLLVDAFVAEPPSEENFSDWLDVIQNRWQSDVGNKPVPWYIEEKLRDGAFATLLGLVIEAPNGVDGVFWHAVAVGDCCLFRVRADAPIRAFPMNSAASFGTRPDLLGSRKRGAARLQFSSGSVQNGDRLLLMTDAVAQWFFAEHEAGRNPWNELASLTSDGFADWVNTRRRTRQLKNDDVTLLEIDVCAANE